MARTLSPSRIALRRTRIAARVLREVESAEAAAAGCSEVVADMVWVTGTHSTTESVPGLDGVRTCGDVAARDDDVAADRAMV